ncbi:HEAT repeat domain-containing protein [Plantactinospora solaniradicis]|uniref:HEAT repeat domain-containing protein n=1 Tax=Plantactinospora solaniradicis TaxID=1723736 RepID=A0ABW1JYY4_9ACTN
MSVSMERVRAALDPEEPNYPAAAQLGQEAVPHLEELVRGEDEMLASKAAYLASLIDAERARAVVSAAAEHPSPVVRVAAAAAARNLTAPGASEVLLNLVDDEDVGVRRLARSSVPPEPSEALSRRLAEAPEEATDVPSEAPSALPPVGGLMPGEAEPGDAPVQSSGLMPGESPGRSGPGDGLMPGESAGGGPGDDSDH